MLLMIWAGGRFKFFYRVEMIWSAASIVPYVTSLLGLVLMVNRNVFVYRGEGNVTNNRWWDIVGLGRLTCKIIGIDHHTIKSTCIRDFANHLHRDNFGCPRVEIHTIKNTSSMNVVGNWAQRAFLKAMIELNLVVDIHAWGAKVVPANKISWWLIQCFKKLAVSLHHYIKQAQ